MSILKPIILLLLLYTISSNQNIEITGKVVQIQPVALDIILSIYDRAVVLFIHDIPTATHKVQLFQNTIKDIIKINQDKLFNNTLFAVCDISKDNSGRLKKYAPLPSIQLITPITNYHLKYSTNQNLSPQFFHTQFTKFIQQSTSSKLQQISISDINSKQSYNNGYLLLFTAGTSQHIQKCNKIHNKIFDYLNFFNTVLVVNKILDGKSPKIDIYYNGQIYGSYAQSAVQALFNFTKQPVKEQINDLVDFINVETIDDVTVLTDKNYFRVFGSSIQYQILLVTRQTNKNSQQISHILHQFQKAAKSNRIQGLKYQRIIFATGTIQFLKDYFADNLLQDNKQYQIIITKTDYSSFQLRKFIYQDEQVTNQKILQFIHDVRLKKIDARYKSQKVQNNQGKKIRKIVGDNFFSQIFQQPQKSVMVLFIDTKEPQASQNYKNILQQFVQKYYQAFKQNMNVGIFDLAKNQHKALTISHAPQLILFQRTNKKKPKFYKGKPIIENIKNWINYQVKDITIPENFGQPPIALGGSSSTQPINNQL